MDHLLFAAIGFLTLHSVLAAIDGLYLHLWRYRLHARPASRREHLWHTLRAVLFPAVVGTLFLAPVGGPLLWLGAALFVADMVILMADVLEEPGSRSDIGGLSGPEYALHVVLTVFHVAAFVLLFAARPLGAWSISAPLVVAAVWPPMVHTIALNLLPGAVVVALVHILLLVFPHRLPAAGRPAARHWP
ncbi:MAG: hypothetical protein AAFV53_24280 [Myxococcota bacterium]